MALWSGRPPGRPPRYREQSSLARSTGRPTGPEPARCAQGCARRSTGSESLALCIWAVDRPVDRIRELCSLYLGDRPGGRPGCSNGHIFDRWQPAVDRPVDREKTESRALWSGRPAQVPAQRAQICARRSTDRSTARACQALFWVRKQGLKIL